MSRLARLALATLLPLLAPAAPTLAAQEDPDAAPEAAELLDALLGGLFGFREVSEQELQAEVADLGGVAFRTPVRLEYLSRDELAGYIQEIVAEEYPASRAQADERVLTAFGLLPPGTDLRRVRARLLEQNIVGFYDERPARKSLYAVSRDKRLTPANQLVMAHELRHALQDQHMDLRTALPESIGDFDDRRLALLCLLEGDATLFMERFLIARLPRDPPRDGELAGLALPVQELPGVPPVLRDQLALPYARGRDFAHALWAAGGWPALRTAWDRPPASTEQVLHPEKYRASEPPLEVTPGHAPTAGRLIGEGVLGELLTRTLLGAGAEAATGWGGDRYAAWDVAGRTLLVWRSRWDSAADAAEFFRALRERLARSHGRARVKGGWTFYQRSPWWVAVRLGGDSVTFVGSDDGALVKAAARAQR